MHTIVDLGVSALKKHSSLPRFPELEINLVTYSRYFVFTGLYPCDGDKFNILEATPMKWSVILEPSFLRLKLYD